MKLDGQNTGRTAFSQTGPRASDSQSLSDPIATFYGLTIAAAAVTCTLTFSVARAELILLFAVAVAALFLFRMWMPGLLLLIVQTALYLEQPQLMIDRISPFDLLISFSVVTLLIASSRFLLLAPEQSPVAAVTKTTQRWLPQTFRRLTVSPLSRSGDHAGGTERATGLLRAAVAVAGAAILLMSIPIIPDSRDEVQLIPVGLRLISLGILLLGIFLVTDFLLSIVAWKRISPREARLFLGSVLTSWCDRELRTIHRQEQKLRQRRR